MDKTPATGSQSLADNEQVLTHQARLYGITKAIHEAGNFVEVLPWIEKEMLTLLQAERLTVYQRGRHDREIVSRYKTGKEIKEIRLALSPSSVAGFVALSGRPVRIDDVHDRDSLVRIHPKLRFDDSFDQRSGLRTASMLVVPIKSKETLLGVLQIINRVGGGTFTDADLAVAQELASVIGLKFHYEFQATQGPFDYLLQRGLVVPEKLEEMKGRASRERVSVPTLLMTELKIAPEEVGESLERYYQVPFQEYDPALPIPQDLLRSLNRAYLKSHLCVPVGKQGDRVTVVLADPNDLNLVMEVQRIISARSYEFRVGIPEDILRFLGEGEFTVAEEGVGRNLSELLERLESEGRTAAEAEVEPGTLEAVGENEATVVTLVNRMIADAARLNASDIHVEPGKGSGPAVVRMRIDGDCREVLRVPAAYTRAVIARVKIMARLDIAERRLPQDGKIGVKLQGRSIELRVATIPTVNGEGAVLRLLGSGEKGGLPLDKLDISPAVLEDLKRLAGQPQGILLVVGPTGSGKTTTLHAILGHLNTPDLKIWTAEDPVEITQPGLQQLQVQPQIGLTFAAALRSFLRADPDVILIGEMRDKETARIGIEASLTGHLVMSTLHTNSAPETVNRLLGLGLDPMDFAEALRGILAQRLVRTLCACKEPYQPSAEDLTALRHLFGVPAERFDAMLRGLKAPQMARARQGGCEKCGGTGYLGRTGIYELLVATPAMKKEIAGSTPAGAIRELAVREGMITLMQDGIRKVLLGQTDVTQLRKVVAE